MHTRSETNWLDVSRSRDGTFVIRDYGRLGQIASELVRPGHQHPTLSVFLGKKTKDIALQSIFPQNNIRRTKPRASIGLRYDMITVDSDNPILFADGDLSTDRDHHDPMPGVHDYSVTWDHSIDALKLIYACLLFLFSDCVCIFADDYPNLLTVAEFLVVCTRFRPASGLPEAIRPRVLVVLQNDPGNAMIDKFHEKLREVDSASFSGSFYSVNLFYLGQAYSESTRYDSLRTWIKIQTNNIQAARREKWVWWNILHLKALFLSAIRQFTSDDPPQFDIVKASREANPVTTGLSSHISHFLELGVQEGCLLEILLSAIASALLMDHYTPEMILLDPKAVFQTLYRSSIVQAFRNYRGPAFSRPLAIIVYDLERDFVRQFHSLVDRGLASVDHRREQLLSMNYELGRLQSDRICLYCLVRTAQHALPCCHNICDVCPQLFGTPVSSAEYQFTLSSCLLCNSQAKFVVDVLPPTMNPTILAIDGGGVRGGIPLEYMIMVQESLGPGCQLRDLIDLAIGSSSGTGGLLVLGLIGMEWDVSLCSEKFDFLARRIFRERRQPVVSRLLHAILGQDSLLGNIPKWLSWFLHDSCYDPRLFDTTLQDAFSRYKRIFDPACGTSHPTLQSKPKFGVVAASIAKDTRSFIFGNFNAVDWFSKGYDYELFRAETRDTEPLMWEVARATAAAPFFFSTAHLRDIGSFQDGGLQDNFAAGIASRLYRRIWPSKNGIARLISLGTGDTGPSSERSPHFRHVFRDGFLRRGFDAFMANLGAASKWRLLVEQLNSAVRPDYIRMDVSLNDMACTIDNVEAMDDYRNLVILQPGSAKQAREAATALLVARFYFALDHHVEETFSETLTWCHGTIRCKGPAKPIVNALRQLHPETIEFTTDSESLVKFGGLGDICLTCGRYKKHVALLLRHPAEEKNIYLRIGRHQKWRISGFPASVQSLDTIQRLGDHPFGRPDHGRPSIGPCDSCDSQPSRFRGLRRKRTSSISAEDMGGKRVCIVG
ncbi:patatin-like phospholipase [Aspergillus pseudonomiae]|uniref:Patatin-like phospholipase n=1 Tax=Aspergillus pseudonomiae TaxID=1506151 RepID=A0A5N7CSN2_9EURO|nr:patatin-like phospholipase [Aspergillus pseudonomiae]KAE8396949.1 patatin-like phospholipase [Aspergillus pseudonomiae]